MLCVHMASGVQLDAIPVGELKDVRAMKRHLRPLCGKTRFQQRLLYNGSDLDDHARLDSPMDLQLVLLRYGSSEEAAADLVSAARRGNLDAVEQILQGPQNPNCWDEELTMPLLSASQNGHTDVVSLLLEASASINAAQHCFSGETPLDIACSRGHTATVNVLLQVGADVNGAVNGSDVEDKPTPLRAACEWGHCSIVSLLLEARADPNLANEFVESPLCQASKDYAEIVRLLAEAGSTSAKRRRKA